LRAFAFWARTAAESPAAGRWAAVPHHVFLSVSKSTKGATFAVQPVMRVLSVCGTFRSSTWMCRRMPLPPGLVTGALKKALTTWFRAVVFGAWFTMASNSTKRSFTSGSAHSSA
jgi:hypothetical protein